MRYSTYRTRQSERAVKPRAIAIAKAAPTALNVAYAVFATGILATVISFILRSLP